MKKVGLLICGLICFAFATKAQDWKVNFGSNAPSFVVEGKDQKKISSESLRGKVVLLNFFATWCPPCRRELPRLQKEIWEPLQDNEEFAVLVLAREEGWDKIDPFVKDNGYTFPVYPDLKRGVFGLFADQSIPRNVVLDRSGKIIYQSIGFEDQEFTKMVELIKAEVGKQ